MNILLSAVPELRRPREFADPLEQRVEEREFDLEFGSMQEKLTGLFVGVGIPLNASHLYDAIVSGAYEVTASSAFMVCMASYAMAGVVNYFSAE